MMTKLKDALIWTGLGLFLLLTVSVLLRWGVPEHIALSNIEGWSSFNSVGRMVFFGVIVCGSAFLIGTLCVLYGIENWFQRAILPSWLTMWQKPATLREQIMFIVAKALGVKRDEVTEETKIANLYAIIPHLVAMVPGRTVYGNQRMTVRELLEQVM